MTYPFFSAESDPVFIMAMREILSITQANTCVITTTYDGLVAAAHGYKDGLMVRVMVPPGFGMRQIDKYAGYITVIDDYSFSLPIDTTAFDAYAIPSSYLPGFFDTPGQIIPIGNYPSNVSSLATYNTLGE